MRRTLTVVLLLGLPAPAPAVDCVVDAAVAGDCEALADCGGWYLVY